MRPALHRTDTTAESGTVPGLSQKEKQISMELRRLVSAHTSLYTTADGTHVIAVNELKVRLRVKAGSGVTLSSGRHHAEYSLDPSEYKELIELVAAAKVEEALALLDRLVGRAHVTVRTRGSSDDPPRVRR
jgi:hypothetical protein